MTTDDLGSGTDAEPVDLLSKELAADLHAGYARLRERSPVLTASVMGGPPMCLVTRYSDVRSVLVDPRFRSDPASVPDGQDVRGAIMSTLNIPDDLVDYLAQNILSTDGADHTRLRRLVARGFTARRVARLRSRIEEITARLLDELAATGADGGPVDLVEGLCYPLPITVICELVGIPVEDRPGWQQRGRTLSSMNPDGLSTALREVVEHVHELIARRRAAPADDMITELIQAQEDDGDRLSDREMVTMVIALVIAGHDTTAQLLASSVQALLEHPGQLAPLIEHSGGWTEAVQELMRMRGPVFGQVRYPTTDVEVGGTVLRAGKPVMPGLLCANTDPREFDRADELDLRREIGPVERHLTFGKGAHYCLGAPLVTDELEIALRALFTRFPRLSLAEPGVEREMRPGSSRIVGLSVHLPEVKR
ncbi:cytochrome P450 family protein [Streptomyces tsukubensis]|uniref:cytochrome P450 family protein n=1 Tax=Streptomyces tsukubensis TaxID=83656 RepID=UPI001C4E0793|nr:cytochrome P450 [Streptomyces tsukubensis]